MSGIAAWKSDAAANVPRIAFDGSRRRRIFLMRHGDVSYVNPEGSRVSDSNAVPLTPWGREQATATGKALAGVSFDKAVCSTLPRTRETLECVLAGQREAGHTGKQPAIEQRTELVEVQGGKHRPVMSPEEALYDLAYAFRHATEPGASYHGGDVFADLYKRVEGWVSELLADDGWETALVVAHGGINRFVLSWAMGAADLRAFASWDQNTSCYNIIDVDQAPSDDFKSGDKTYSKGGVVRKSLRAMNVTAFDLAKEKDYLTSLEQIATKMKNLGTKH
ncbi:phosphoglycerate mutase [Hyaloraphidium curvatum]|nr:phosphoglycerate mutase [Hyaloraphidium curvatum]